MNAKTMVGVALAAFAGAAWGCTGFYVGRRVSADGTVMLARTVDSAPWNTAHRLAVTPRIENAPGRTFGGVANKFAWPLPPTTWRFVSVPYISSLYKRFDGACANEKGLVVTGTVTAHAKKELIAADPMNAESGTGEDSLPGLVASCCATAREAVDLLAKVVAERGHNGGEIYMFADRSEAWLVEVYTGHQWAAVKMPEDKVAAFGNQFMIASFDPSSPDVRCSPDLVALPKRLGKLVLGADGLPDLVATYAEPRSHYANYRTTFAHNVLAAAPCAAPSDTARSPLFFAPKRKVAIDEIFALSRSRYEGTDHNPEATGNGKIRTIGTTKQGSCHVIQLDCNLPPETCGTIWAAMGNAEHVPYLPVNAGVISLEPQYAADQTDGEYRFDINIASHSFRRLAALAEIDRRWYGAGVRKFWETREAELVKSYGETLAANAKGGIDGARKLTAFCRREQARAYRDSLRIFDDLMWYVMANNRIEGDGSGATAQPDKPFEPK